MADTSFGCLHVFYVELSSPHRTSKGTFQPKPMLLTMTGFKSVISYLCWDWTRNLQMILLWSTFQPNALSTTPCVLAGHCYHVHVRYSLPQIITGSMNSECTWNTGTHHFMPFRFYKRVTFVQIFRKEIKRRRN